MGQTASESGEQVLIIGGGPAGSTSAMHLLERGFAPLLVESDTFPRFHIGESLTTECVDALNRLGLQEQLIALRAPRKQGVRIFAKHPENSFFVGAGDAWQVERARFDLMMLETAVARGATRVHGKVTHLEHDGQHWHVTISLNDGGIDHATTRFVIDGSGQNRFSLRKGLLGEATEGGYSRQVAFFSQFENIASKPEDAFDTLIFHRECHEWAWMIPLSETVMSVGLVVPVTTFKENKQPPDVFFDTHLMEFSASLVGRLTGARRVGKVRTISNYSYRVETYAKNGLFCVGDSHAFIDPIFSFGVEFAVCEAAYAAEAIAACREASDTASWRRHADRYMQVTSQGQRVIEDLLDYFWRHPWGFANMAHVRHREEFLEIFAGRIYETQPGEGLKRMRATLQGATAKAVGCGR